ncbi:hypothetical protein HQ590_12500 [bacterium]|nr:hypothetical protein [bacterium]
MRASLELTLADGTRWLIQAHDDEAAKIVARLNDANKTMSSNLTTKE